MSKETRSIAEERLHAYVDGQLAAEDRQEIEEYLRHHPADAARVNEWQRQNEAIQALFAPIGEETVPERLRPAVLARKKTPRHDRRWPAMAAALLLLALGGAGGWLARPLFEPPAPAGIQQASLVEEAFNAHRIYTVEVLHPVEVTANEKAHLAKWLSKRLRDPIRIPALDSEGFALMGGRLLPASNGPAAQFMYEDKNGRRITLYTVRRDGGGQTAFRYARENGINAFYWIDGPLAYALAGEVNRATLQRLARSVYAQLEE